MVSRVYEVFVLYVVSFALAIHPGNYSCSRIAAEEAGDLIKQWQKSGDLTTLISHGSASRALKELTGIKFTLAGGQDLPRPSDGDEFIELRVSKDKPDGRPTLKDLEFFHICFSTK